MLHRLWWVGNSCFETRASAQWYIDHRHPKCTEIREQLYTHEEWITMLKAWGVIH